MSKKRTIGKRVKVLMNVNEMTDVDVGALSFVKHAANRSPIKILKSKKKDGNMHINLKNLFKKAEEAVQTGVVLIVAKSEKALDFVEALKVKGIEVLKQEDSDGATTLHLTDADNEDITIFKMSEDVAVGVSGITKSFSSWGEGESFVKNMATAGFFPGVRVATDVFMDTLGNIMYKSEKDKVPMAKVEKLADDFGMYVKDLLTKVPVEAFKYEGMLLEKAEAAAAAAAAADIDITADPDADAPAADADDVEKKKDTPAADADTETVEKKDGETEDIVADPEVITKTEVASLITEAVKDSSEAITAALTKSQEDQTKVNESVIESMDKISKALNGIVSVDTTGDTVNKEETDEQKGDFDDVLKFEGYEAK